MSDLRDLYQEVILDHSRSPRNFGVPEGANRSCEGYNPLCGDRYTVHAVVEGDVVQRVGFEGDGCAISKAAASTMTQAVEGMSRDEVSRLFETFHGLVTGELDVFDAVDELDKLAVFSGVSAFPMRVKCATLAWHTLQGALAGTGESVTTE